MNKRQTGTDAEKEAGRFLESRGYRILQYNFRAPRSEIDIVAMDGRYLVFAEVKKRSSHRAGYGSQAVGVQKQRRICAAALWYMRRFHVAPDVPVRFDVVSIDGGRYTLYRDAFPFAFSAAG